MPDAGWAALAAIIGSAIIVGAGFALLIYWQFFPIIE